jgi:hypothetical protein
MRFFLTLLMSSCLALPASAESLLLHNLRGHTANHEREWQSFDWILIEDGRVVAIGNEADTKPNADSSRDLNDQVVMPGLIDAHGHIAGLGLSLLIADLRGITRLTDSVAEVARFAQAQPELPWVQGRSWNQVLWTDHDGFPTAADLDTVIADRPVFLERVDGHAGWVNSKALEMAGITADTPNPPGGEIIKDADGRPTGVLIDTAMEMVTRLIPEPDDATLRQAMVDAMQHLLSVGLTGAHDAGVTAQQDRIYRQLNAEGAMPVRIWAMIGGVGEDFDAISQQAPMTSPMYSIASVKLYNDGALGSRGAALHAPYSDAPETRGLLFNTTEELTAQLETALSHGFQVNVHAIGDRANTVVLESFANAYAVDDKRRQLRNRIEHAQVLRVEEFDSMAELDLIASMQPIHATSDKNMAEDRLGSQRIKGAYAWQRVLDAGVTIASGSDFPVEPANPFYGLHAAVTRQDREDAPAGGWYADQALTIEQALNSFTIDAAFAGHAEQQLGRLLPGFRADFIVLKESPLTLPPGDLWELAIEETWVNGKQAFAR